jgi:hypothetical protein
VVSRWWGADGARDREHGETDRMRLAASGAGGMPMAGGVCGKPAVKRAPEESGRGVWGFAVRERAMAGLLIQALLG